MNAHTSFSLPGLQIRSHRFSVPLDYKDKSGPQIEIFVREVNSIENSSRVEELPFLIWFSGGPGFQAPRPSGMNGWLKRAVKDYRVLLLDQRGTGLSSAITYQSLSGFCDATKQAEYLKHFRADNIVRDAEFIRQQLSPDRKWTGLGQSFGGFCLFSYLSLAPEGLEAAIVTGGIPPIGQDIDDVYRATYKRVLGKNKGYFERYPGDREILQQVLSYLRENEVFSPNGEILSARHLQQVGLNLGFCGGFEQIHYALEDAFIQTAKGKELNFKFLLAVDSMLSFNTNPIYALLHEAIYLEGTASNWSAERVRGEFPEFDPSSSVPQFTGEMVYPWMFDEYSGLKPLKEAANSLAMFDGWTKLYDMDRLRRNSVPTVASLYWDDMYVEAEYSEVVARQVPNLRLWVTNEYEHSGLRDDGERILDRLLAMLKGTV